MRIRDAGEADFDRILELNDAEVDQTSPMDRERLRLLDALAQVHWVVEVDGRVVAFLIAMREDAAYKNDNFEWIAARFSRFLYIDRIVVDAAYAGRGIGAALYRQLFEHALAGEVGHLACEYNIEPPNPASKAFHEKSGFKEVGTQWLANGSKQVSLQVAQTAARVV